MIRTSSSVLLTRGAGADLEVLLVERSPALRFLGGYWAFPGGVLDPELDGGDEAPGVDGEPDSLRACAARELFEETGVLLPPWSAHFAEEERATLRSALLEERGDDPLARWRAATEAARGSAHGMRRVCRLTTPEFSPLRFRTLFLHATLPAGEELEIVPGELVDGRFVSPAAALADWRAGAISIAPPVLFLLECLAAESPDPLGALCERADRGAREMASGILHPARFSPGVLCAPLRTPTVPPATTTNCYVVGERELWIVDPATYEERERRRLFEFLDGLRGEGRELRGVLVTHHHADHVGSVSAVAERYRLPVLAHARTLARIEPPPCGTRELREGDELPLGAAPDGSPDWNLVALHTPGHDQGHLAFLDSRYRSLIAGDLVSTLSTIVIDPPEGHLATYLASLRRMLELGVVVVHPAHGPAERDGPALLRHYLDHRAAREAKLHDALERGLADEDELLAAVYDDVDPRALGLARRSLAAGLEHLEEQGRAARDPAVPGRWVSG